MALLCKNKKEGGSARASPMAAPMPKSVLSRENIDCLEGECVAYILRTFHRWGSLVYIMYIIPN